MIIDLLSNCANYVSIHKRMKDAFHFLQTTDLDAIAIGKHTIDGDDLFAIVQEYETMDTAKEQMEAHKKYIDVQYMIKGTEVVGHALLKDQTVAKEYDASEDYGLYDDAPDFFTKMAAGTFMIFYPTDLHMPCIKDGAPAQVKKVVIKVKVEEN